MKKTIFTVLFITLFIAVLTACSVKNTADLQSTTVVTDENGNTHVYEVVTDDESQTTLKELETDSKGNAVTEKGGEYVTKKEPLTTANQKHAPSVPAKNDDNEVTFEGSSGSTTRVPNPPSAKPDKDLTLESTTEKPPATDENGWINKWY